MDQRTIDFYDKESANYSAKRYSGPTIAFPQYLFRKRMGIFLSMLEEFVDRLPEGATMLEIGCADGILFKEVERRFPGRFKRLVGIDISPKMVEEAKNQSNNPHAQFFLKDNLPKEKYDIVIELGVHPYDLEGELRYASERLNVNGMFFFSAVGSRSLYVRLKMKGDKFAKDYLSYRGYKQSFKNYFFTLDSKGYGFFIPKLWSMPALGKTLQPIFDWFFQKITPELFHERIYLLRNKTNG